MIDLKYIVTGTGRCGTLFLANYLTSAGINCSHEAIFNTKGIEYAYDVINEKIKIESSEISKGNNLSENKNIIAESSYMSAPFLNKFKCKIIHLIRNPIKVASSFISFGYFSKPYPVEFKDNPKHIEYEKFIFSYIPELKEEMTQLDRAVLYWIRWNQLIEKQKIDFTYKIESPINILSNFLEKEGNYYNKLCNSFGKNNYWSIDVIKNNKIKKELKEMMSKYDYKNCLF